MNRSDIYLAIAVILAACFLGGLAEYGLKIGIPACPQITATVTVSDTAKHRDTTTATTPGLTVTVGVKVKPKPRPVDTVTGNQNLVILDAVIVPVENDSAICYCIDTTTKNKTRVIDSVCSKSFPKMKPDDFYASVKIFEEKEAITNSTTQTAIKEVTNYKLIFCGFLLGVAVGAGTIVLYEYVR